MPFQFKLGGKKKTEEEVRESDWEEPPKVAMKRAPSMESADSSAMEDATVEKVCQSVVLENNIQCATLPSGLVVTLVSDNDNATSTSTPAEHDPTPLTLDQHRSGQGSMAMLSLTVISSALVVVALVGFGMRYRRKQRRQRRRWRNDSQIILTRVEDVMLQLEERDEQIDLLQQKLKLQEEAVNKERKDLEQKSVLALQAKQEECQEKSVTIELLREQNKEFEGRLEHLAAELKRYVEGQQDHECQLLEQKLQASQLSNMLSEREAAMEEVTKINASQQERIKELQEKIKSDSFKAEKIIGDLTSERDERFAILQQENDAIKTTIMGMLRTTQNKYDADKVLLKREMRKRDDKIASLQQELWKSNSLLKRLQTENHDAMSQSVHNLIFDIKHDEETTKSPNRRSSTYEAAETILEGEGECPELKALETLLSPSYK